MASVFERQIGEYRDGGFGDTSFCEALRQANFTPNCAYRSRTFKCECFHVTATDSQNSSHSCDFDRNRTSIEIDDRRQAKRVGKTMMNAFFTRQRMCKRMASPQPFLKSHGSHHRSLQHSSTRY